MTQWLMLLALEEAMPPFVHRMVLSRLLILTWLISWVITIPLFHVHLPDVKDGPVFFPSGLAHTVFSPDLPGEFSHFSIARDHRSGLLDLSQRALNYPELGFSVLNNNPYEDRKPGKQTAVGPTCCLPGNLTICCSSIEARPIEGRMIAHGPPPPSRAPPFLDSM